MRLIPEAQAIETLLRGFDLGVNLVHTAPDYEGAEEIVAKAVARTSKRVSRETVQKELGTQSSVWNTCGAPKELIDPLSPIATLAFPRGARPLLSVPTAPRR